MNLAITNKEEIGKLMNILNEIESIAKYENIPNKFEEWKIEDAEYYPIINDLIKWADGDPVNFIECLFRHISNIHHQRILWNCETLLINCADPNLSHLDFNPKIKRSFEFVEKMAKKEKGIAPSAGYFQELIEEAEKIYKMI